MVDIGLQKMFGRRFILSGGKLSQTICTVESIHQLKMITFDITYILLKIRSGHGFVDVGNDMRPILQVD